MNPLFDWIRKAFSSGLDRPAARGGRGYPSTSAVSADDPSKRPQLFDPALLHYTRAFRVGEPTFASDEQAARWRTARRRATEHVLSAIVRSPWGDHLVLRGSLVMRAWFGDVAREPGDIDWTIVPETITLTDKWSSEMFAGLVAAVADQPRAAGGAIHFDPAGIATDDIWTYDRAPGRRIVYPWSATGDDGDLPRGAVQCDFVFGEPLPTPAVRTPVPLLDVPAPLVVRTADLHASLAWKLLWLETDLYPQGKDLFDAVLLAERARETSNPLPYDVLMQTLTRSPDFRRQPLAPDFPMQWQVDWENFRRELPRVEGEAMAWQARLTDALSPTFAGRESAPA